MDKQKILAMTRADVKACAESLLRAVDICDTVDELDQLNAAIQSTRQVLQGAAYLVGKALQGE